MITIRITDKAVRVGLQKLGNIIPNVTEETIEKRLAALKKVVSGGYSGGNSYTVPLRAGQSYNRTGNFGRSVFIEQDGHSYRLNTTAYSPRGYNYGVKLVGNASGQGQAWWAAGRWPIASVEAQNAVIPMLADIDRRIRESAESLGF